jgi:hypothetical protein
LSHLARTIDLFLYLLDRLGEDTYAIRKSENSGPNNGAIGPFMESHTHAYPTTSARPDWV